MKSIATAPQGQKGSIKETFIVLIEALLLAFIIRSFLFQPFSIPSGSMRPTLYVGDYLLTAKYAYGYSHFSLPFSPPLFSGRLWSAEPQRGDIVVFRNPGDTNTDFIKRVIGLPGDKVQMQSGVLYLNGVAVPRVKIGETVNIDAVGCIPPDPNGRLVPPPAVPGSRGEICDTNHGQHLFNPQADRPVGIYRETLPNGVSYNTFDIYPFGYLDNTRLFEVPQGYYFMMGDNRDNSDDSRESVGYVPFENLIGRANLIFFSISDETSAWKIWDWPAHLRWQRLFSFVWTIKAVPAK
ncbi:signal peptidase I [Candidatus Tokpelaia sp.]|uniref:signal peptidase I n=1 Tax=Candidatus Tokpelaia sp. TaxID=2233777 RepID=UPI0012396652|nr:signal peptidase I [Candidatus Tokpelaia sp.]KAA6405513.1 signal peptidase I [Candidatus Tokpelaia sp.]